MKRIYVTPRPGRRVRDPLSFAIVPDDGKWTTASSAWCRLERDGDCTIDEGPKKAKPASAAKK